ncbi:MAG: FixH family protein [Alphaproteobacteria bacterium]|nr:FixH family protein [Alphaproteobacteria bacterium]
MTPDRLALGARVVTLGAFLAASWAGMSVAAAAAKDYHFELVGKPTASSGKETVRVRLLHVPDNKPVRGAVVFESRADMGPQGMPTMTSPIKAIPQASPDVYVFEVEPGMTGTWAITLAAKVQGEAETVRGTLNVDLVK